VAAHPGGPGIFDAIERALRLPPDALSTSRRVFSEDGNASRAGIFFVLDARKGAIVGAGAGHRLWTRLID